MITLSGYNLVFGKLGQARVGVDTEIIASSVPESEEGLYRPLVFRNSTPGRVVLSEFGSGILLKFDQLADKTPIAVLSHMAQQTDSVGREHIATNCILIRADQIVKIGNLLALFLTENVIPPPKDGLPSRQDLPAYAVKFGSFLLDSANQVRRLEDIWNTWNEGQRALYKACLHALAHTLEYDPAHPNVLETVQPICFIDCPATEIPGIVLALSLPFNLDQRTRLSFMTAYTNGARTDVRVLFSKGRNQPTPEGALIANWKFGTLSRITVSDVVIDGVFRTIDWNSPKAIMALGEALITARRDDEHQKKLVELQRQQALQRQHDEAVKAQERRQREAEEQVAAEAAQDTDTPPPLDTVSVEGVSSPMTSQPGNDRNNSPVLAAYLEKFISKPGFEDTDKDHSGSVLDGFKPPYADPNRASHYEMQRAAPEPLRAFGPNPGNNPYAQPIAGSDQTLPVPAESGDVVQQMLDAIEQDDWDKFQAKWKQFREHIASRSRTGFEDDVEEAWEKIIRQMLDKNQNMLSLFTRTEAERPQVALPFRALVMPFVHKGTSVERDVSETAIKGFRRLVTRDPYAYYPHLLIVFLVNVYNDSRSDDTLKGLTPALLDFSKYCADLSRGMDSALSDTLIEQAVISAVRLACAWLAMADAADLRDVNKVTLPVIAQSTCTQVETFWKRFRSRLFSDRLSIRGGTWDQFISYTTGQLDRYQASRSYMRSEVEVLLANRHKELAEKKLVLLQKLLPDTASPDERS